VLVVFLHSFSFMTEQSGGPPVANRHSMELFRAIMDHVTRKNLAVVDMRQLARGGLVALSSSTADVVPRVAVSVDLPRYAWRRAKSSATGSLTIGAIVALLFAGAGVGFGLVLRRKAIAKRSAGRLPARRGAGA
jgi:hypothetical protein